jgi:DNA-binding NarL/FixJ family response regulator
MGSLRRSSGWRRSGGGPERCTDVVVMDAVMPRRNGFDATREIVRNSPEIPVVITTFYEYPEILRQAQISGALGCVGKS